MRPLFVALDLGTTGNRAIAFSADGQCVAQAYAEFPQYFPKPGWVEHDASEILTSVQKVVAELAKKIPGNDVRSIGITNQRETIVCWDKQTGKPVHRAIVWQCRRTSDYCASIQSEAKRVRNKTGLPIDPYFSASKLRWILKEVPEAGALAAQGRLLAGTIDTWILWNLASGHPHQTDVSNASRTMLFNIHERKYDPDLLALFEVPAAILPQVVPTISEFGMLESRYFGREIPILALIGDQQAALFAQGGDQPDIVKNTYGTGLFVMASTGDTPVKTEKLVSTIAWQIGDRVTYALEGSIFVGGSVIQWLRDQLHLVKQSSETDRMAAELASNEGVYFVPALTGLGAPYWKPDARGMIYGLTRGTTPAHLVRAALESLAYQSRDVIDRFSQDIGRSFHRLRADGGASRNRFLMQFQADMLNVPVDVTAISEITALGAAVLAGIGARELSVSDISNFNRIDMSFMPQMDADTRACYYQEWTRCIQKVI